MAQSHIGPRVQKIAGSLSLLGDTTGLVPNTWHPMGGASMGTVCDHEGRVQGQRGLYVLDGALLPGTAAACNPWRSQGFRISGGGDQARAFCIADNLDPPSGHRLTTFVKLADPAPPAQPLAQAQQMWRAAFDVNVTSAFFVTRRAIPHLKRSGHGSIINNLSLSVQTGGAGGAGPYAAAKGALQVMTRTLARELAPHVRANAIMPGVIETRHHELFSTPERMADYRKQTPLARNGRADEVANAVLFLASDASSFVTGATIDINGGRFLR